MLSEQNLPRYSQKIMAWNYPKHFVICSRHHSLTFTKPPVMEKGVTDVPVWQLSQVGCLSGTVAHVQVFHEDRQAASLRELRLDEGKVSEQTRSFHILIKDMKQVKCTDVGPGDVEGPTSVQEEPFCGGDMDTEVRTEKEADGRRSKEGRGGGQELP